MWFAFILYLWNCSQHLNVVKMVQIVCCDLLLFCIFEIAHNIWCIVFIGRSVVVICFYFVSLKLLTTSSELKITESTLLWFAFILYLWNCSQHHSLGINYLLHSCDLLLFCIFEIAHNIVKFLIARSIGVVICFYFVSLKLLTTSQ